MPVYVINLDRDTERLQSFLTINQHIGDFIHFHAIDGRLRDRETLRQEGIISQDLPYYDGQLGCALSHIAMWHRAAVENNPITVVEDDAILARDFLTARDELVRRLPADWSIVLWGWNFDSPVWAEIPEGVATSVQTFDQNGLRENIEVFRRSEVAHAPVRLRHAFGTLAYTVSPAGASTLLKLSLPLAPGHIPFDGFGTGVQNNGIDCVMNGAYPKLKAYLCMPPLAVSENRKEGSTTFRPA